MHLTEPTSLPREPVSFFRFAPVDKSDAGCRPLKGKAGSGRISATVLGSKRWAEAVWTIAVAHEFDACSTRGFGRSSQRLAFSARRIRPLSRSSAGRVAGQFDQGDPKSPLAMWALPPIRMGASPVSTQLIQPSAATDCRSNSTAPRRSRLAPAERP